MSGAPLSSGERRARIADAGFNVLNLEHDDVDLDLVTDVPTTSPIAAVRQASHGEGTRLPHALDGLTEALYGPARFVFVSKGRAAEWALARALFREGMTVVSPGLFVTAGFAIAGAGASVEIAPTESSRPGVCNLDLEWLEGRVRRGRVDVVYVEASNNNHYGWPLELPHLRKLRELCDGCGAKLVIDATRLFANAVSLGEPIVDHAKAVLSLADAFVMSCAKEQLVPHGGIVGVRDLALQRAVYSYAMRAGTLLEPAAQRQELAAGLVHAAAHPDLISERRRRLEGLAAELRRLKVPFVEPVGGHAIYVTWGLIDGPIRAHGAQALLYLASGVRAVWAQNPIHKVWTLRLPLVVGGAESSAHIAASLRELFDRATDIPELVAVPSDCISEVFFSRYRATGHWPEK